MDIYEFQGKELFRQAGIPVSEGRLVLTPQEARDAAAELGCPVVVKAQVLTGGRGKAGGVKLAVSPADAEEKAKGIFGLDIKGHVVHKIWVEQASDIAKEYYLSLTFDRGTKKPLFMFTTQGGVEIDQVVVAEFLALQLNRAAPTGGLGAMPTGALVRIFAVAQGLAGGQLQPQGRRRRLAASRGLQPAGQPAADRRVIGSGVLKRRQG